MTTIQHELDRTEEALRDSGVFHPSVRWIMSAHSEPRFELAWYGTEGYRDSETKTFRTSTELRLFREELPTADERRMQNFHRSLGQLIEKGREAGLEDTTLSGLLQTHEALTTNLLTHRRTFVVG